MKPSLLLLLLLTTTTSLSLPSASSAEEIVLTPNSQPSSPKGQSNSPNKFRTSGGGEVQPRKSEQGLTQQVLAEPDCSRPQTFTAPDCSRPKVQGIYQGQENYQSQRQTTQSPSREQLHREYRAWRATQPKEWRLLVYSESWCQPCQLVDASLARIQPNLAIEYRNATGVTTIPYFRLYNRVPGSPWELQREKSGINNFTPAALDAELITFITGPSQ